MIEHLPTIMTALNLISAISAIVWLAARMQGQIDMVNQSIKAMQLQSELRVARITDNIRLELEKQIQHLSDDSDAIRKEIKVIWDKLDRCKL